MVYLTAGMAIGADEDGMRIQESYFFIRGRERRREMDIFSSTLYENDVLLSNEEDSKM
jgi:hypothetical protein